MRFNLAIMAVLFTSIALPAAAQDDHSANAGAITIVHPWARAANAGDTTMVFFEIENAGDGDILEAATTPMAPTAAIVGATMADGAASVQDVGAVDIGPGDFDFEPKGLGIQLTGLATDLVEGEDFELTLNFATAGSVTVHVEIEAADATQHSHAGHSH